MIATGHPEVSIERRCELLGLWFELNRQQHKVKETTYYWRDKVGDTPLLHFAVTTDDGGAIYELVFNPFDESWALHSHKIE